MNTLTQTFGILAAAAAALFSTGVAVHANPAPMEATAQRAKPAIVLVHGAFADGSSWSKVIPLLRAKGYHVVAVQNPTTSLADDVAATERVVNQQKGPVVLVGHSWAGVVITQAGNNPKVDALVYVSASAPDTGQSLTDAGAEFAAPPWVATVIKDEGGFMTMPDETVFQHFAQDLTPEEQGVVASVQIPWAPGCLTDKVTKAAWHDKPSWWVIGSKDHTVAPALQEKLAGIVGARVTRVSTGHLAMLADPTAVTDVIVAAADHVQAKQASGARVQEEAASVSVAASLALSPAPLAQARTARDVRGPAGVVPLSGEPPVRLVVDPPLTGPLGLGRVVVQYRAENLRIEPVFGPAALKVSPRVGHIHVTVDDLPWHWLDASGEPLTVTGLPPGRHKILIELVNAAHQTLDYANVDFEVPVRSLVAPDPKADGFRAAPEEGELAR